MKFRINDIIKFKDMDYSFKLKLIDIDYSNPYLYKLQVLECKHNGEDIGSSIYKIGSSSWKLAKNVDKNYEIDESYKLLKLVKNL